MRKLLYAAVAVFTFPVCAATQLADCAVIESALERLDCFDELARQESELIAPEPPTETANIESGPVETAAGTADALPSGDIIARFGNRRPERPESQIDQVTARIESVSKTPLGHHVVTLSNGQIWVENEPGRRSIAPGQKVKIRQHRWHFEMELNAQPNVAVRRVD